MKKNIADEYLRALEDNRALDPKKAEEILHRIGDASLEIASRIGIKMPKLKELTDHSSKLRGTLQDIMEDVAKIDLDNHIKIMILKAIFIQELTLMLAGLPSDLKGEILSIANDSHGM